MQIKRTIVQTLFAVLAIFSTLLVSDAAWAQTTGQLRGVVWDEDEIELPGVSVELSSEKLIGGVQSRTTGVDGAFKFVELPPGLYTLRVFKEGWTTVSATGIVLKVSRTTVQNITLKPSTAVEEIEVTGTRPVVDTEDVSRSTDGTHQGIPSASAFRTFLPICGSNGERCCRWVQPKYGWCRATTKTPTCWTVPTLPTRLLVPSPRTSTMTRSSRLRSSWAGSCLRVWVVFGRGY